VNQDPTAITVASSSLVANASVTFTATVKASSPGSGTPTGTVTFIIDGVAMATNPMTSGKATLTLGNGLSAGTHTVEVEYSGDTDFAASNQTTSFTFSIGRGT
jgi:hypothetical protein